MSWISRSTQDHPAPRATPWLGLRRSYVLPSETHSPEKLASRPPAIKGSGDPPTDSAAHRIMPRVLSPRRAQAVAVISSPAGAGAVLVVILLWFRGGEPQQWAGGHNHSQPLHACTHGAQPSSLIPHPHRSKSTSVLWGGDARTADGGSPALGCHLPHHWAVAFTWHLPVLGARDLFPKGFQRGKDSPRPFCTGTEQSEWGLNVKEPHCPYHRQQLKHCNRVGTRAHTHPPQD